MDEFAHLDATAQAQLVRRKDVASAELVEAAIRRIEQSNPALNAVVTRLYDSAREAARRPLSGPFAGVPFLVKDLLVKIAGARGTAGSRALAENVDATDSELGRRYRAAGLIVLGKTSTPELGLLPTSEPALFGPAKNPWDRSRSTGGSSGGSAAAVAARLVPAAHGNDGGGSIRLPASCCGVFGFKPSRGRNPLGPDYNDPFLLVAEHVLSISVRDSAALLDATCGPMAGEPAALPRPERSFLDALAAPGPRLRIAYTAKAPAGTPVHADAVTAVEDAARLLAALGHHLEDASPAIDGARFYETFVQIWIDGCAAAVDVMIAGLGRERALGGIEPFTRQLWERGQARTAIAHLRARETLARVARQLGAFFERYDVWLTPTTGHPPPPLGHFGHLTDGADAVFARSQEFVPWTLLANTAGLPAMSVPLHWTAEGLPMGVHFVGRAREDTTLFRLARELEDARPWASRLPPV